MQTTTQTHSLQAFTVEGDFIPTLYVEGEIPTNGEKPVVEMGIHEPQGNDANELVLYFQIDVYNPSGSGKLRIKDFSKPMKHSGEYNSVRITTQKGDIVLKVVEKNRSKSS